MTCIAAVKHDGKVHMAGDSLAVDTNAWSSFVSEPKVFVRGVFAIGFAGDLRAGQVAKHLMNPSAPPRRPEDMMAYMVGAFTSELRKALTEAGCDLSINEETGDTRLSLNLLVGVHGRIFTVDDSFAVTECVDYGAIGCGADLALGSLRETKKLKPRNRLQRALSTATAHSAGVGGTLVFVSTP